MQCARRCAFSLVELLVVVGLIGILLGLILPAVQQARGSAARIACANSLKQVGLALHGFHQTHGRFPPLPPRSGRDPNALLGWMAIILPHIEEEPLYRATEQACATDPEPTHNPPHVGFATVVRAYVCASDGRLLTPQNDGFGNRAGYTSFIGIGGAVPPGTTRGLPGIFEVQGCRLSDIIDGSSLTIMVSERPPPDTFQAGWWYPRWWWINDLQGPNNIVYFGAGKLHLGDDGCRVTRALGPGRTDNPCDRYHLWSLHGGGANFLFADGSGRFLSYSADPLMTALATRAGGESVQPP